MYVPKHFSAAEAAAVDAVIDENDFALLVSQDDGALEASHLPLSFDRAGGRLIGHIARANAQWRAFDGRTVMAVFSGPHGYVSPRWYAEAPAVPTWNYVAAHVYGRARIVDAPDAQRAILRELTRRYEGEGPWSVDTLPETYFAGMLRGIVGFEIAVDRIDAKFKLSQNRPSADRQNVVAQLRASGRAGDAALADAMRRFGKQD
jgi:transcriptional regulator